jgi:hypothetical protein
METGFFGGGVRCIVYLYTVQRPASPNRLSHVESDRIGLRTVLCLNRNQFC